MTLWTFPVDEQDWALQGGERTYWVGSPYHNSIGSIRVEADIALDTGMAQIDVSFANVDQISLWARCIPSTTTDEMSYVVIWCDYLEEGEASDNFEFDLNEADSGWVECVLPLDNTKTVIEIFVGCGPDSNGYGIFYFDDILIGEADIEGLTHSAGGIPGSILEVTP